MERKSLPVNIEAEKSVLYCVFMNNNAINDVYSEITEEDFFYEAHAIILKGMKSLYDSKKPIDTVSIFNYLQSYPEKKKHVDDDYISEILNTIASPANISYYIQVVKEKSTLRRAIITLGALKEEALSKPEIVDTFLQKTQQQIFDLVVKRTKTDVVDFKTALTSYFKTLKTINANQTSITGVSTGFAKLDEFTGGLQKTDLIILAARPGMGKTSFALNLATNAAKKNHSVAIFSLEMPVHQLVNRIMASEAALNSSKLRLGKLKGEDWVKLKSTFEKLLEKKIFIDETPAITTSELASKARTLKMREGLDLIVIDYLQLMKSATKLPSRELEISEISRTLKALAKELQIPVIALSQLNRSLEKRTDKRPILSDLRESGAIEQDADVILFIYRGEIYKDQNAQENTAEIIIGKNRNGSTGDFLTVFQKEYTRFDNIMDQSYDDDDI